MKGQLKQADRIGAGATVIVGAGLEVRDMATGVQTPATDAHEVARLVDEALAR
jgi:hypothetical protein